ncbi:hypothetical protein ABH944_008952, partial [Caballeronia udeis]
MKSSPYFTLVAAISASTLLLVSCGGDSDNHQPASTIPTQDADMYLTCPVVYKGFWFVQCVGSRTDGMPTVDQ